MNRAKASALLRRVQDQAISDLMRTTDEELLREALEDGENVDSLASALRARLSARVSASGTTPSAHKAVTSRVIESSDCDSAPTRSNVSRLLHAANFQSDIENATREEKQIVASSALLKLHELCRSRHCSHLTFDHDSILSESARDMRLVLIESLLATYINESEEIADLFPGSRVNMLRSLLHDAIQDPQISSFASISLRTLASTLCTLALGKASGLEFDPHQRAKERDRILRQIRGRKEWRAFHNLIAHQPEIVTDSLDASRAVSALATMERALAEYKPDAIVAVEGGGEIVGSFLRGQIDLDARYYFVASKGHDGYVLDADLFACGPKRVVVVDDISRTGRTLTAICNQTFGGVSSVELKALALVSTAGATSPLRDRFLVFPVVAHSMNVSVPWDNRGSYKSTRADHVFGADRKAPPLKVPKRFYERIYEDVTA